MRSTLADLLRALAGSPQVEVKIQLWKEISKHKDQIRLSGSFLEQTLGCIKRTLSDSENSNVQFAALECSSSILEFISDSKLQQVLFNELSTKTHKLMIQATNKINESLTNNSTLGSEIQDLFTNCQTGIQFFGVCVEIRKTAQKVHLLQDFHPLHNNLLTFIHHLFSCGPEWAVHLNSRKHASITAESLRNEQSNLFTSATQLLAKFIEVISNVTLDIVSENFEAECNEMLFICNKLLPICEISASWQSLMDVSWKGVNTITTKYSNALEGKLDVDRIIKSLSFIVEHKFKECVTLAPRFKISANATKQILPTSDQKAFIGSVKFVRFALVVLVSICKKYVKYICNPNLLAKLAVEIRSQFPPSPSSHSLAPASVEAFAAIIPALETLFKVLIVSPSVDDMSRWKVFNAFSIINPEDVNLHELPYLFALEKLQYLNALISSPMTFSHDLLTKIATKCLPWIMNGLQLFTSDILYSSNQLCKASKTPLYTKTFIAVASFVTRCGKENAFSICLPWIIENIFHPHFLCNELATEVWCFVIRNSSNYSFIFDFVKEIIGLLQQKKGNVDFFVTYQKAASIFIEKTLHTIPEHHRAQLYREILPSPIQMSSLEDTLFVLSVVPFKYAGTTLQNTACTKVIKLCIQKLQEKATPTFVNPQHIPLLRDIFVACNSLLREEKLVSCLKDHRLRLVEQILQLLPFPQVHYSELGVELIQLAVPLRHDFDIEQLATFSDLLVQVIQASPRTKLAAIEFMKNSGDIDISQRNKLHAEIFGKWKEMNGLLLEDTHWPIRHALLLAIEKYSKFSLFDFKAIIPPKHLSTVLAFLKRDFTQVSAEFEYSHLKNQQMLLTQVIVGRKRGLPLSQEFPNNKKHCSPEDQIEEGLKLIRQGLMSISPNTKSEHKSKLAEEFRNLQNV